MTLCVVLMVMGCGGKSESGCHITGTVDDLSLNGTRIFLVPFTDSRAEVVDSVVISDGKFEFSRDTLMLAKIIMDYHYRENVQTLLVVCEPGEVAVRMGVVSSASGTPQNDSLQRWKEATEKYNLQVVPLIKDMRDAKKRGDKAAEDTLRQKYDSVRLGYKHFSRRMAANMPQTVLGDFLNQSFPKTYQREYPDGMVVEFDADTNQPIDTVEQTKK